MLYQVEAVFAVTATTGLEVMFATSEMLEGVIGRESDNSGCGFGQRDLSYNDVPLEDAVAMVAALWLAGNHLPGFAAHMWPEEGEYEDGY